MEFEPTINYNCDVSTNPDGSLTLTGKEDQNTFSSNGVTVTLEKGASITVHSISRKPEPFTVWIDESDSMGKEMAQRLMERLGEEVLVIGAHPPEESLLSGIVHKLTINNRDFFPEPDYFKDFSKQKKLNASTFQHRKGAFANGGRG